MPRWVGIDVGEKRIGVAVSDPDGWLATAREVIEISTAGEALPRVLEACRAVGATGIVVGLPLNMDGSRGEAARKAETFARELRAATGLPVHLWDERLTTRSAHGAMLEAGLRGERRRGRVDMVAAQMMLQSFLDAGGAAGRLSGQE
ncbi:MAG: Holliday junction resolvase RuvX [Kiritimatiellae bacterium]|nr:Holliday junction resolvase RuvX [Kiritimatiellia bacterium]MDW8459117.1 Holliday junction resolvase RuvX [Verrucomicrobiota bacterium]